MTIEINPTLRPKAAAKFLGISTTLLWRLEQKDPNFPQKIRLSARAVCYRQADLEAYLESKKGA